MDPISALVTGVVCMGWAIAYDNLLCQDDNDNDNDGIQDNSNSNDDSDDDNNDGIAQPA